MSYSHDWLESQESIRMLLVVATIYFLNPDADPTINGGVAGNITLYLSTSGYTTESGDTHFLPVLDANSVKFTESLNISTDGGLSVSYGDISIHNQSGELDKWLDSDSYIWINGTAKVYYGDPRWSCNTFSDITTTFKLIFDGIIKDIDSKSNNQLNIKFVDKMERLNVPISEEELGTTGTWDGGQPNKTSIKPLVFGEVFNFEPLLIDPSQLEYMFGTGQSARLIEIRDNGVPIYNDYDITDGAEVNLLNSTFKLLAQPAGTITVSCQGTHNSVGLTNGYGPILTNSYTNTIAHIIATIVTQYGHVDKRLNSMTELDIQHGNAQTPTGYLITSRENLLTVCRKIAGTIGAGLYFNRVGKLQLLTLSASSGGNMNITEEDIVLNSLSIKERTAVISSVKLGYAKNWHVQSGLETGIPQSSKDSFATEWLELNAVDEPGLALYKTEKVVPLQETYLIDSAATTGWSGGTWGWTVVALPGGGVEWVQLVDDPGGPEASRRLNLFKIPRTIYKFTSKGKAISLELGNSIQLKHSRFGLKDGVGGIVVGLSPNWIQGTVEVEIFV